MAVVAGRYRQAYCRDDCGREEPGAARQRRGAVSSEHLTPFVSAIHTICSGSRMGPLPSVASFRENLFLVDDVLVRFGVSPASMRHPDVCTYRMCNIAGAKASG